MKKIFYYGKIKILIILSLIILAIMVYPLLLETEAQYPLYHNFGGNLLSNLYNSSLGWDSFGYFPTSNLSIFTDAYFYPHWSSYSQTIPFFNPGIFLNDSYFNSLLSYLTYEYLFNKISYFNFMFSNNPNFDQFEYTQNILNILMGRSPIMVIDTRKLYDPKTGEILYSGAPWGFVPSRGWEPLVELF